MSIINFFSSLIFSWFILFLVQPLMRKYGLNKPKYNDEKRDLDVTITNKTLRGGGLAFIISTLFIVLLNKSNVEIESFLRILISCIPLASLGLIDDYYHIPKPIRFFFQLITSSILLIVSPLTNNIYDHLLSIPLIIFLVIAITGITNFINFMDGMDGLIAGCMIVILISIGIKTSLPLYILVAALVGFLIWNWSPAKIYMGDVGSTFLGALFCGTLLHSQNWDTCLGLLLIATPLLADALICIPRRYLNGQPIFREPHKLHLYQRLNQAGWGHSKVSCLYILGTLFLSISYLFGNLYILYLVAFAELGFGLYLDKYVAYPFKRAISSQSKK